MRLAAQAKLGFYPAAPEAITAILAHLKCQPSNPEKKYDAISVLDPCAGEGAAIRQISDSLGVPETGVYTVELDPNRAASIRELIPTGNHCGPATFLAHGCQITGLSFGLVYANPPFDDELGGGRREELAFVEEATRKLAVKGVLVLVCPLKAIAGNRRFVEFVDSCYDDVCVYKFPDEHRRYNEIVVFGKKRKELLPADDLYSEGKLHQMQFSWSGYTDIKNLPFLGREQPAKWYHGRPLDREESVRVWEIPRCWKPSVFKKNAHTDEELSKEIELSPLNRLLEEVVIPPPPAPPLPLGKGHVGLVLADGMLDGFVNDPYGGHVVRGSSYKVEYHNKAASSSSANPDTGTVTTTNVYSQRPVTIIRAVGCTGEIHTYSSEPEQKEKEDDDPSES